MKTKIALLTVGACLTVLGEESVAVSAWEKYVAERALPWSGEAASSAEYVFRELDEMDTACDEKWCALKSKADYDAYRLELRKRMLAAMGTFPARTPLDARTTATVKCDGYTIEKVIFESMPGVFVTANLFIPDGTGKRPTLVMSCGHSRAGKDADVYLRACVIAAKNGFVALMFDPYGQGERHWKGMPGLCYFHDQIGARAELVGWSMAMLRVWDGMRAIDYALSRPEVDAARLGYMGQSGGGTMTALMEAADDRIRAAAPSCYLTSLRAVCQAIGPQDAEQNIFGQLAFGLNHTGYVLVPDIPVAVTCKFADMFPFSGVQTLFKTVRTVERNVGLGERTFLNGCPGPHGWTEATEQSSVRFLAKHLMPGREQETIDLPAFWQLDIGFDLARADQGLKPEERGCTPDKTTETLPGSRHIFDILADKATAAAAARKPLPAAKKAETVRRLAKIRLPKETGYRVKFVGADEVDGTDVARLVVQYPRTGAMVPAVLLSRRSSSKGPVMIAAWGGRTNALALARKCLDDGHPVALVDPTAVGETGRAKHVFYDAKDRPDEGTAFMLYLMGETLVGRRATDLLVLAEAIAKRTGAKPKLLATGPLAIAAAHAYAADRKAWSGLELVDAPASWSSVLAEGAASPTLLRYADLVPGALCAYDWTELVD